MPKLNKSNPFGSSIDTSEITNEAVTIEKIAGSWVTPSATVTPGLNADRTPSATRPVLVVATVGCIINPNEGDSAIFRLCVAASGTPVDADSQSQFRASFGAVVSDVTDHNLNGILFALVPAGHVYRIRTTEVGSPQTSLVLCKEYTL